MGDIMKKNSKLVFKGFIVGLGKIIPGVSGALLAISMGIYDAALEAISHFFKDIKKNVTFLLPLGLGLILAIIFCSNIIAYLINHHYFVTMLLFLGLILGGVPSLLKTYSQAKFNRKDYGVILIVVTLTLLCWLIFKWSSLSMGNIADNSLLYWLIIGCVDAATMIIPGISGTAIFVMLGCYNNLINVYSNPLSNLDSLIPFFIGLGITVLILTRIITWLFKNCQKSMYMLVIILLFISIISLITSIFSYPFSIFSLIVGIILLICGFVIASRLEK